MQRFTYCLWIFCIMLSLPVWGQQDSYILTVPENVQQGDVLRVICVLPEGLGNADAVRVSLLLSNEVSIETDAIPIQGYSWEVWHALLGIDTNITEGEAYLTAHIRVDNNVYTLNRTINIVTRVFRSENIALNRQMTQLRSSPDIRKKNEAIELWKVLNTVNMNALYHYGKLFLPISDTVEYWRSSEFGDRRTYEYSNDSTAQSIHNGLDFAAVLGTPVLSAGNGKVIMAKPRIITGGTVIIEHYPGMYSLYYHLDTITVRQGAQVKQGETIGTVGSTGLATGAHLHWEVRVEGVAVDPEWFVSFPVVDTYYADDTLSQY